jgi:hypothetical protein
MLTVRPPTPGLVFDAGRWLLEEFLRELLPPDSPEILRALSGSSWRLTQALKAARHAVMVDELRRSFSLNIRTAESAAREAEDCSLQAWLEKILAPRIEDFSPYLRIEGQIPEKSLLLSPSVTELPLLHAALSSRYPGLVIFRQRGFPPGGVGPLRDNWLNRQALERRLKEEERLGAFWESDSKRLALHLEQGARVLVAFDDRAWKSWKLVQFLGRQALLSPEPWELAEKTGAKLLPVVVWRERDKSCKAVIGGEIKPDLELFLRRSMEPWLKNWPGQYAMWLAECRMRAALDDHPLFVDYALDGRWKRWAST